VLRQCSANSLDKSSAHGYYNRKLVLVLQLGQPHGVHLAVRVGERQNPAAAWAARSAAGREGVGRLSANGLYDIGAQVLWWDRQIQPFVKAKRLYANAIPSPIWAEERLFANRVSNTDKCAAMN
jgi:hypothetical protein